MIPSSSKTTTATTSRRGAARASAEALRRVPDAEIATPVRHAAGLGLDPYAAVMASIAGMLVLGAVLLRWLPQPPPA